MNAPAAHPSKPKRKAKGPGKRGAVGRKSSEVTRARDRGAAAEWVATDSLVPWPGNPKKPTVAEVQGVADSIDRFTFGAPLVARLANREIIAGHTRWLAAKKIGLAEIPCRFLDLSEDDAHLLALADNELGADWEPKALLDMLEQLKAEERRLVGWTDQAFAELQSTRSERPKGEDAGPGPLPEKPVSKLGERYELGPHVLVCGDACRAAVWQQLLGDERIDLVWIDPPYGVDYEAKNDALKRAGKSNRQAGATEVENDGLSPEKLREFLDALFGAIAHRCREGASWYVAAPAGPLFAEFGAALAALGIWKHTLAWVKDQFVLGRTDYHYRHEPIFYGWVPNGAHYWAGARNLDSVLEFARPKRSTEHPTMKPPELVQHCIVNSSRPGAIVADGCGGSGSTLIAAAVEGRRARLVEKDPRYCDVIRKRWGDFARSAGVDPGSGAL